MKPLYYPAGLWGHHDFQINKYYWKKHGYQKCLQIRINNLIDINNQFNSEGVFLWLQGKTLLGVFHFDELLDDHDDDFGVFFEDRDKFINQVLPKLEKMRFRVIRFNDEIISLERDFRYIDLCFFKRKGDRKIGYGGKIFKACFFREFATVDFHKNTFNIPTYSHQLLKKQYYPRFFRFKKLLQKIKKLRYLNKYISSFVSSNSGIIPNFFLIFFGFKKVLISKKEFLNLNVEPRDSFNWLWRKLHLDLVTNNGKLIKVKDIVNYLCDDDKFQELDDLTIESDTSKPFISSAYDMDFWWSGNNYFWYCVKFSFRKNVVPYNHANEYIESKNNPLLYSKDYYDSLDQMSTSDITNFLRLHPIEIENNSVVGGKHRVFAMIGRLVRNQTYIPMTAIVKK